MEQQIDTYNTEHGDITRIRVEEPVVETPVEELPTEIPVELVKKKK
jgi:hypothetical protein